MGFFIWYLKCCLAGSSLFSEFKNWDLKCTLEKRIPETKEYCFSQFYFLFFIFFRTFFINGKTIINWSNLKLSKKRKRKKDGVWGGKKRQRRGNSWECRTVPATSQETTLSKCMHKPCSKKIYLLNLLFDYLFIIGKLHTCRPHPPSHSHGVELIGNILFAWLLLFGCLFASFWNFTFPFKNGSI